MDFKYVIGKIMIEVIAMFSKVENIEKVMSTIFVFDISTVLPGFGFWCFLS